MAEQSQQICNHRNVPRNEPAAAIVATTARWLGIADDVAFGCECADPGLQIEHWREEAAVAGAGSA